MTCPDCAAASTDHRWPGYRTGCRGCSVRALAAGPVYFDASRAGQITPTYRAALRALLGEDLKASHEEVTAEHHRLQSLKKGG